MREFKRITLITNITWLDVMSKAFPGMKLGEVVPNRLDNINQKAVAVFTSLTWISLSPELLTEILWVCENYQEALAQAEPPSRLYTQKEVNELVEKVREVAKDPGGLWLAGGAEKSKEMEAKTHQEKRGKK